MPLTTSNVDPFWSQLPELIWSNSQAGNPVRIRAALLRPRFEQLLSIAAHFGHQCLRKEWEELLKEPQLVPPHLESTVNRMLHHIDQGRLHA